MYFYWLLLQLLGFSNNPRSKSLNIDMFYKLSQLEYADIIYAFHPIGVGHKI
jgi:hypothetical protein